MRDVLERARTMDQPITVPADVVDAIVMASAALRGDAVYTSDVDDLMALHRHFS